MFKDMALNDHFDDIQTVPLYTFPFSLFSCLYGLSKTLVIV